MLAKNIKALSNYFTVNMLVMLVLGFASGLPIALILSTLQAFLKDYEISLKTIGLLSIITSAYTFKFLWAPFLDGIKIPYLTNFMGRRRSWLLVIQIALAFSIYMLGNSNPQTQLLQLSIFALATAFLSASQDIVIDAFRIERLTDDEQAKGAAVLVFAYRIAMLFASAGPLIISEIFSWQTAYTVMALSLIPPIIGTILLNEPNIEYKFALEFKEWFRKSCAEPFRDFFARDAAIYILLFIFFYKMSDAFIAPMLMPFYKELGFTNIEIAEIVKIYGLVATLFGGFVAGHLADKISQSSALFWGVSLQIATNIVFVAMYWRGHDSLFLMFAVSLENFAGGFSAIVLVAYLSKLCNKQFSATQYALFSAVVAGTRSFLSGFSGYSVEIFGWSQFFILSCLLSMPSFLFLYLLRNQDKEVVI